LDPTIAASVEAVGDPAQSTATVHTITEGVEDEEGSAQSDQVHINMYDACNASLKLPCWLKPIVDLS